MIDTSTFFSALYNRKGNEAYLFELADIGKCSIHISDYILTELKEVFQRKNIDFKVALDLLRTYKNIFISDILTPTVEEIALAKRLVNDPKDRPVFIFALRMIMRYPDSFFVSGDKVFFNKSVKNALKSRVLTTREFIEKLDAGLL
ncbi:MAG: PIN domain-containing protein [Thermoplasmata archaeon]|nr:PIN domain-containing protein [Thermoplasmata archaeon]